MFCGPLTLFVCWLSFRLRGVRHAAKTQRSQKTGGVMASTVIFCLDARVEFTPSEAQDVTRYKLQHQISIQARVHEERLRAGQSQQQYAKASKLASAVSMIFSRPPPANSAMASSQPRLVRSLQCASPSRSPAYSAVSISSARASTN